MNVLVAGGAGFIGSNLCAALLAEGHHVVCVDSLITGRQANVQALLDSRRFRFLERDVTRTLPDLPRLERVYHLASPASPPGYGRYPLETLRANSTGTQRLLDLALRDGARFLFTSTSEVYGDPLVHPQTEEYRGNVSPTGPRSMYDEGKRFAEALIMAYVRSFGADARIARVFNTYGPGSDPADGRMVPNFVTQALRGEPLTVYGDGKQTRSLCYVSDLVAGLLAAMESRAASGEVINLGNPEEHAVLDYARLVLEFTGSRSALTFAAPAVGDDPRRRCPDIAKARRLLGWEPRVRLREGLALTVAYFRRELGLDGGGSG